MHSITPAQIRGARGLLDWSMMDLARAAGVSVSTVKRMEVDGPLSSDIGTTVVGAFERAGVEFLAEDVAEGVRVRTR